MKMKKSDEEDLGDEIMRGDENVEVDENEDTFPVELDEFGEE